MSYNFPQLNIPDILGCMDDLFSIQLDEKAFKKIDIGQWQQIMAKLLCEVTGCAEDAYLQQPMLVQDIDYPELHTDSFPLMNLIMSMENVMPAIGISDFCGGDIISPTSQRLRKILSAVINFMRFKHSRASVYMDIKADIEQDREHHTALLARNDELKKRIKNIRAARAKQEPEVAKIQDAIEQNALRMQEHQKNKTSLSKNISDIKTRVAEKKATADQLRCAILKTRDDAERLSQKIVHSPQKVRAEQESLQHQLISLKDTFERKRQRLCELQTQRENYKQSSVDAEKGLQLLEAIHASINKENETVSEMTQILDKIQEHQQQSKEMYNKKAQLQHLLNTRQEKLAKLSLQHQSRIKVLHEQMDSLKQEKEACLMKQNSDSARKLEVMEFKKTKEEEVRKEQHMVEKKIKAMMDMYGVLLDKSDKCHQDIGTQWEEVRNILNKRS